MTSLKKHCKYTYFHPAEGTPNTNKVEVTKEEGRIDGPWEAGKPSSKTDWEHIYSLAKQGKIEEIPAKIKVKYYINLQTIRNENKKRL